MLPFYSCNGTATVVPFFGNPPYQYSWNTIPANYTPTLNVTVSGIYTVTVSDTIGCTKTASVFIDAPPLQNFDLDVNVIAGAFRPTNNTNTVISLINDGCAFASGFLKIIYDTLLIPNTIIPPADSVSGDTLYWNFTNINSDTVFASPVISFYTKPTAVAGNIIDITVATEPNAGDADTTNNIKHYIFPVVNSLDPNDKYVYPKGDCDYGYIKGDEYLYYTIRFENTGTANAINVIVKDTLDSDLDISTLHVVTSSHLMHTEVDSTNILKFVFNNINLPFAGSNKGYVVFKIKPLAGLADGTSLENKAGIIFDLNTPVVTGTASNVIASISQIPDTSVTQLGDSLIANVSGANYQWLDCNNGYAPIVGATNPMFVASATGNYALQISANGCTALSSCYPILFTGLNNSGKNELSVTIFENGDNIFLKLNNVKSGKEYKLELINCLGERIHAKVFDANATNIFKQQYSKGIYIARLFEDGKNALNIKVAINK